MCRNCLVAAAAKSLQFCPTLCDPIDDSPPGSPVPGILQARILEWVAISFSNAWKWKVKVKSLSRVWLLATPLIAAYQSPPSMGFSRPEYWSGVPLPSPNCLVSTQLKVVRVSIQLKENLNDSLKYRTVCWLLLRKYTESKFGRLYYFSFCFLVFLFFNGLSVTFYHWILTCLPMFHIGHQEKNNSKW